ncbi:SpoIIE family protein phosphatase [Beggiatoa leptomitoformis]|uniref:SpoIIE family protein phosphatase n=1 Tax=Beggiatoa leptomitoformis TaxID=288004 RepID=A0A2N9Y9W1_9GAMM|nr:SpoIIE family protein phosphatase [Beggiatoa leptomitoformis]ALG67323.1 SpoIIE family protein phosphatase [Beggiatoa leptomitoformis]AUI67241.1 SpoIIE family protein phosphatase [Beggiatoa leptomitoformis]
MHILTPIQRLPLRFVLVTPFIILLIVTVTITGYLSFHHGQLAIQDLATQLLNEVNVRVHENLRRYLDELLEVNFTNQNSIELGLLKTDNLMTWETYLWRQIMVHPTVNHISFGNTEREFTGVERLDNNQLVARESGKSTGYNYTTYPLNEQGQRQVATASMPNYDPSLRPWYQSAVSAGKPVWSEIFPHFGAPTLMISLNQPAYDKERKLLGVINSALRLSQIGDFLQQLQVGKTGQVFIIERSAMLVATSSGELPLRKIADKQQRLSAIDSNNGMTASVASYLQKNFDDLHQINASQFLTPTLVGEKLFMKVSPYQDNKGLDWLVVIVVPASDFMSAIDKNAYTIMLLCAGALLIAIIIGIWSANRVTRPIAELMTASWQIAKGEWNHQLPLQRQDEIGELARSFHFMATQLQDSFLLLEAKVEERTVQLAQANSEITCLNAQLQSENLRMGAELDITRHLQQMVLPKAKELLQIKELDIAGYMEPATEVGGDYYDVLQKDGRVICGIGDVTGHGLESGVLMLMVQMAVRTLLNSNIPDVETCLKVLNHTLYDNVKRMNSDKNLTLSLLDYEHGVLRLSGQHEEVLVVRRNGTVERIDTIDLGFMVGLESDIETFLGHKEINLAEGDGVVLYTDGLTEARNAQGRVYSVERLCRIVGEHWHLSALEIQIEVIADVRQHVGKQKVCDDITLLILKKNLMAEIEA